VPRKDVLVVSVQSTGGWIAAANELVAALERIGASVALAGTGPVPRVRTFMLTDFTQARAARIAAQRGIAEHDPAAVIYCSITASLLWPRPGAIWLDSIAAENRPRRHGIWQRPVERRRLRQAPIVLPWSVRSLRPASDLALEQFVLPPPVEPSAPELTDTRDIDVLAYAGDPVKRQLDLILRTWECARRPGETLVVAGTDAVDRAADGVRLEGKVSAQEYRALLRRTRVAIAAPKREDHGLAALEALADGCMLVTTPAPGPYPAMHLARELDPRLVNDDLVSALRTALDDPVRDYSARARALLTPYSRSALDAALRQDVLPRLLGQRRL
jgi:Glycosyl transferases group 1